MIADYKCNCSTCLQMQVVQTSRLPIPLQEISKTATFPGNLMQIGILGPLPSLPSKYALTTRHIQYQNSSLNLPPFWKSKYHMHHLDTQNDWFHRESTCSIDTDFETTVIERSTGMNTSPLLHSYTRNFTIYLLDVPQQIFSMEETKWNYWTFAFIAIFFKNQPSINILLNHSETRC